VQISYSDRQGRELMGWSYSYDAAGNLVKAVDSSGQETLYRYGPGGQLLEEKGPSGTRRYSYLAGGNRSKLESNGKTVAYEYNAADQLLEAGDETFRYDADGNLVERTNPRGTTRYTYDAEQRLVKVGMPDGEEVSFGYAPTGQRIWRKDKAGLTWFVTDGMNLLAELDDKLERRAIYLHGPGIDNPLMMRRAGEVYNYHAGHLGNVAGLSDSNGKTVASYLIDAFGNLVERKGNLSNPFLFASRYYEESLGLYYYRARYYDSLLGRFVARDPLAGRMENPRSLNRYLYVLNNPVKARDPLGLDSDYTFWHYTDEKGLQGIRASGGLKYSPSHGIRPTLFLTDIPPNRATNPGQQFGVGASRIQYAIPVRLDEIKWNDKPLEMMPRDLQVRDPRYQHIFLVRGNENELLHLPRTATEQIEAVKWPPAGGGSPPPDPMRDTGAFEPIRPNEGRGIGLSRRNAAGTPQRPAPPQPGPSNRTGGSLAAAASGQTGRVTDFLQQHGGKVTIALTAAHVANCLAQGKTVADCAKEMAIGYIVGGAIVAVVGPTGALILGAAGGAYSIYHAGVEATQQWSDYQQRSAAYEGREHQTRINLQRLEEAVALERNKIQGNLSAAANDAARSCERLRAMASRASNYGNEARSALASLPPADTLGRIKALSEKCAKATQTRAKLEGIQQRVSGYAQQVAAALERLNGWAENCRTAEQASRVRDGYRNAAGLVKGIRQLAADARASGQGLFGLSGEANTIRAAVEKGEGAKYRIISLAGKAVEESSQFDSELARVPEVNQNLQAQCAAALRDIDSLRAGFPDALEPALDAKFQELRGLVSTFTSRNCSPDAAKGQFLSDRSSAVDARLEAENRLSALQGALSGLDGCESLDVSGLLASIESAESEAASHLLVHADLPGRAADCDKTANAGSGGTGGQGSGTGDQQSGTGSQGTEGTGRSGADLIDRFTDRETRRTREVGSRTPPPLPPYPGTGPGYEQGGGSAGGPNVLVPPPPRDWGDDARGGRGSGSGGTSSGGHKGGGSGGGKSPCPGGNCGPPKTAQFKCKTNSECWGKYGSSGYYCNRGSGQCVRCPSGQHGRKDGYPACHSE
jgi:RHS repeat-associated protein